MKTTIPASAKNPAPRSGLSALKAKKDALERGERAAARVFKLEKHPDGTIHRIAVNPEAHRRRIAKAWDAKSQVTQARQTLDLTHDSFADMLGVSLSTLRSWEQGKREPSGAARMLISIALKHPEVFQLESAS